MVTVDPLTGLPRIFMRGGQDNVEITDYSPPPPAFLSQDPDVAGRIIQALLEMQADQEWLDAVLDAYGRGGERRELDPTDEDELDRVRRNLQQMLSSVLERAAEGGDISQERMDEIIAAVNQSISDSSRRIDLNREVPDVGPTPGVDEGEEQRRQQQRQEAEQRRDQQQQQRDEKRRQIAEENQRLIEQIQQRQQEQLDANEKAAEEKRQAALDQIRERLPDSQRDALDERLAERNQQQSRGADAPPSVGGIWQASPMSGAVQMGGQ